jgi:pimeloyl-ACP methyl ester carboxylesterase
VPEVELTAGTIEYEDTGGSGPVLVLVHGLLMDGSLWRHVVADLRSGHRCVVPTLPLGGHRQAMRPDADLSLPGQARILSELLDRLDLRDVTLAFNDWGGPILLASSDGADRIGRLVPVSCEAFDNYPPGVPGHMAWLASKVPGGANAALQPLRVRALRRLPITFGWMSKRGVPDDVMDEWLRPVLTQRAIRRDLAKYAGGARQARPQLVAATERLAAFDRPALVAWAAQDRVMPPEHGRRLAELLPNARLVEVADSYTLIPEDQPGELARAIREFVRETSHQSSVVSHQD